jgi:glycosyltransferase involved in cell wall biosynthesis
LIDGERSNSHIGMTPAPILFAHYGQNWIRGSEQCLLDLVANIDRQRFSPMVVCNQPVLADTVRALHVPAVVIPEAAPAPIIASRHQVRALAAVTREWKARLIHANTSDMVPAVLRVARAERIPLVAHIHVIPDASERRHLLLHQASVVVGVSQASIDGFAEEGTPAKRLRVIHNAVDGVRISAGDASALRHSLGIPKTACVAATVGSLIERKAHDIAIRAISECRARGVDVHLLVCGSGEEERNLRDLARALSVTEFVHFLGFQSHVGAILRDATDVCLAPSRWEALPLNVLEAQWLGVSVIASDIPAHQEALLDRISSTIVPLNDSSAMATALTAFIQDTARPEIARTITQPLAQKRFSMERYISEFEALYAALLETPRYRLGWMLGSSWPRVYSEWARSVVGKRLSRAGR